MKQQFFLGLGWILLWTLFESTKVETQSLSESSHVICRSNEGYHDNPNQQDTIGCETLRGLAKSGYILDGIEPLYFVRDPINGLDLKSSLAENSYVGDSSSVLKAVKNGYQYYLEKEPSFSSFYVNKNTTFWRNPQFTLFYLQKKFELNQFDELILYFYHEVQGIDELQISVSLCSSGIKEDDRIYVVDDVRKREVSRIKYPLQLFAECHTELPWDLQIAVGNVEKQGLVLLSSPVLIAYPTRHNVLDYATTEGDCRLGKDQIEGDNVLTLFSGSNDRVRCFLKHRSAYYFDGTIETESFNLFIKSHQEVQLSLSGMHFEDEPGLKYYHGILLPSTEGKWVHQRIDTLWSQQNNLQKFRDFYIQTLEFTTQDQEKDVFIKELNFE